MHVILLTILNLSLTNLYKPTHIYAHYVYTIRYIGCGSYPSYNRRQASRGDGRHRAALSPTEPGCSGGHSGGRGGRQLTDSGSGRSGGGRIIV